MKIRTHFLIGLLAVMAPASVLNAQDQGGSISVAISDNLIVIDESTRSGQIDLVNGGDDPMEFTVFPMEDTQGIVASAEPILRWAPEKAVAPAHRSLPFRVLARTTDDLPAGEYAFQFGVRALVQREQSPVQILAENKKNEDQTIGAVVPVVPVLPVLVYVRHKIETPRVEPEAIELTPEDPENLGYFIVVKKDPNRSFVGQIRVIDMETGVPLSSGRLHLAQAGARARVGMPREGFPADKTGSYCLQVWDQFPGQGDPYATICS